MATEDHLDSGVSTGNNAPVFPKVSETSSDNLVTLEGAARVGEPQSSESLALSTPQDPKVVEGRGTLTGTDISDDAARESGPVTGEPTTGGAHRETTDIG